jgi:MoaA/NifB/PqqE/SkfB family radical SAM enzyme
LEDGKMIINKPVTAVWEITMGCNMRCKHCGSSCHEPLPGELTTDEALNLCDAIGELGMQWITLSGGEPTTRKDWDLIAGRLAQNGVVPNLITNGWLFDEEILNKAIHAGVETIAFSIDGLQKTHDFIRREGSYQRTMRAIELCRGKNINAAVITTISKMNLSELMELKQELVKREVGTWQVQLGFPMGNMAEHRDAVSIECIWEQNCWCNNDRNGK